MSPVKTVSSAGAVRSPWLTIKFSPELSDHGDQLNKLELALSRHKVSEDRRYNARAIMLELLINWELHLTEPGSKSKAVIASSIEVGAVGDDVYMRSRVPLRTTAQIAAVQRVQTEIVGKSPNTLREQLNRRRFGPVEKLDPNSEGAGLGFLTIGALSREPVTLTVQPAERIFEIETRV